MESQPKKPEFRNNLENFHPWYHETAVNTLLKRDFAYMGQRCGNTMTWSHFIRDKLKISIYLPWDKYKEI